MKIGLFSVSKNITPEFVDNNAVKYAWDRLEQAGNQLEQGSGIFLPIEGTPPSKKAADINAFFHDPTIDVLLAVAGGVCSNEILDCIDYDAYATSNKILCGFSDISVLLNALYAKTGKISLHAPNLKTLSTNSPNQEELIQDTLSKLHLSQQETFSFSFTNRKSYFDVSVQDTIVDGGMRFLHEGEATGIVVGGNLSSINLLIGTEYMPDLNGKILFLEECFEFSIGVIRRNLFHLASQNSAKGLRGIVFGRIQQTCYRDYDFSLEDALVDAFGSLHVPIVLHAPFGHVSVNEGFFVGSRCTITSDSGTPNVVFCAN